MRFVHGTLGFLLLTIYVPGLTGAAVPTGWPFLWLAIPALLIFPGLPKLHSTPLHWVGIVVLGWAVASVLWTPVRVDAVFALAELATFAAVFCWAGTVVDPLPVYIGVALGLTVNDVIAILQIGWDWQGIGRITRGSGLLVSSNVLAEIGVMVMIVLAGYRKWRYLPVAAVGIICGMLGAPIAAFSLHGFTVGARGALAAGCIAGFTALARRAWRLALAFTLASAIIAAVIATFAWRPGTVGERIGWWRDAAHAVTLPGNGIGSFDPMFPAVSTARVRPDHLHNDYLELAFEIGVGIVPAIVFCGLALASPRYPEWYGFLAFLIIATVELPLHVPPENFLGAFMAGRLARGWSLARLAGGDRRSALYRGLAAAGCGAVRARGRGLPV